MIKPEQIPDEVVEALIKAIHNQSETYRGYIAAALNAWPEAKAAYFLPNGKVYMLPAPWENNPKKAVTYD